MDETSQRNIKRTATPKSSLNLDPFRQKYKYVHDFVYSKKILHKESHATGVYQNCLYILRYKINSLLFRIFLCKTGTKEVQIINKLFLVNCLSRFAVRNSNKSPKGSG